METKTAPDLSPGYPSQGTKIGPAWADAWARLTEDPSAWLDGQALWREVAKAHGLSPETVRGLLFRMATPRGPLERDSRQVLTGKGRRNRTHFRIKENTES